MNFNLMIGALFSAALVSLSSPLLWRPLLQKVGTLDMPNHRSSHTKPTLRGGGLAPMAGAIVASIAALFIFDSDEDFYLTFLTIGFGLLICWVGLVEDIKGIPTLIRAASQLAFGSLLGILISILVDNVWIWIPLIALFYAANVNFVNFMDGVNGISSMFAAVVGAFYGIIGWIEGQYWLMFCGLLIITVFVPFLWWNLTPPGMFLGDVGSYLLGGLTAAIVVVGIGTGISPLAMIAPISIYWADTLSTLLRRALRRESILQPHRTHIYQQLTDRHLSHLAVSLLVALYSAVAATIGLFSLSDDYKETLGALIALLLVWVTYISLPMALKGRKEVS